MPRFSSGRERRLWLLTLAVVVAIYATLGLAKSMAGLLTDRGLLSLAFSTAMLLVLCTIVTEGLKTRPRGLAIGAAFGIAAVYLLVFLRMSIPEERSHLLEYSVVAVFIHEALKERVSNGFWAPMPALSAFAATCAIGIVDELIQALLPSRVFDSRDIVFNVLAAVMAIGASVVLDSIRRRIRS